MYGQFNSALQSTEHPYINQQYSNKDDYSIKNTQQCKNYSLKGELNALNTPFNDIESNLQSTHGNSQQMSNAQVIINSSDQWSNYYDQNSYSLTPNSVQSNQSVICNQSNLSSNVLTNVHSSNLQPTIQSNDLSTNIQPANVQLNIQLNVQNNISQQTVHQYSNQLPNHFSNSLPNRLSSSTNKPFNTFTDYSQSTKDTLPLNKKIKNEKINFNLNYTPQPTHTNSSEYFHATTQTKNQIRQSNQTNFNQCDLAYTNQSVEAMNNFDLSTNLSSSTTEPYYLNQTSMANAVNPSTYQSQPIKSDQLDFNNLNSLSNNLPDTDSGQIIQQQKKLNIENNGSLKAQTELSNLPIQSSHPIITHSINSSSTCRANCLINPLDSTYPTDPSTLSNHQSKNNNSNQNFVHPLSTQNFNQIRPLGSQNKQTMNSNSPLKSPQKSIIAKQKIKIAIQNRQNRMQNQINFNQSSSLPMKLVDRNECVPNKCKLSNSNKANQNRKSIGLDEEEKKRRRRERNKVAATKCRNKKKAHVVKLNEQGKTLDTNNKLLNNELNSLKIEQQRLLQTLMNHRTFCDLRFYITPNQLDQIYANQYDMSNNFEFSNFNQSAIIPPNESLKNLNRIKNELNYDPIDPNSHLNNNQQFNNQPVASYDHSSQTQLNPIIKIENYNYSTNQMSSNNPNNYLPSYDSHVYSVTSQHTNYDQFNLNSTNYGSSINNNGPSNNPPNSASNSLPNKLIANEPITSSNLTNAYLCTNDDTPNVFPMC